MFKSFLIKLFLKDSPNENDPKLRQKIANLEVIISVFINVILFIIKIAAGFISGSFAMISDAIHTLSDIISSAVVWAAFLWSSKPADEKHPFGHGNAEHIGGFIVAVLLIVVGIEFMKEAINKIIHPTPFTANIPIISLIIVTILLKELSAQIAYWLGNYINSKTLHADGWHHRTDALTSVVVLIAFVLQYFGITGIDGWASLIISGFIVYAGINIAKESINPLLGEATETGLIEKIKNNVLPNREIINVHDIIVHAYGHTKACCLHIELSEDVSLTNAHDISEKIEEQLISAFHFTSVTIHADPVTANFGKYSDLPDKIALLVKNDQRIDSFHDLRIAGNKKVLLDLVPNKQTTNEDIISLEKNFIEDVNALYPELAFKIKIEPKFHY